MSLPPGLIESRYVAPASSGRAPLVVVAPVIRSAPGSKAYALGPSAAHACPGSTAGPHTTAARHIADAPAALILARPLPPRLFTRFPLPSRPSRSALPVHRAPAVPPLSASQPNRPPTPHPPTHLP